MSRPWQRTAEGVHLRVRVQPRATSNRIMGVYDGALKISLTAPPVEGEANAALSEFLATFLRVPQRTITLRGGVKSRNKQVRITTATPERVLLRFEDCLSPVDKKNRNG